MLNRAKEVLRKYKLRPKRYLGQNFLINEKILEEIVRTAHLNVDDTVLEVGSGLGNLTERLARKVKRVVTIEKDKRLVKILSEKLGTYKKIKIIEGDALKLTARQLNLGSDYKIIANLPYYITSPFIKKFLERKTPPKLMNLMVQKEVAERICAKPPKMSLLSVSVQLYSRPKIIKIVKKHCFWPVPKIDSAIIQLIPLKDKNVFNEYHRINKKLFFKIVKAGFSHPRKQIKNNLKKILKDKTEIILNKAKINQTRRAETLTIRDWTHLCIILEN